MTEVLPFLIQCVTISVPIILVAMAGFLSERSGVINIGLEGKMLMGAFFCAALCPRFGPATGVILTLIGTMAFSVMHWVLTQVYRIDHIISGMAINLLAAGATSFLKFKYAADTIDDLHTPSKTVMYAIGILAPLALWWMSRSTRFGLQHRGSGSDPGKARLLGVNPQAIRFWALLGTGALAGLGGCILTAETQQFTDGMTSGRGYIALAALILGGWRPIPAALACLLFGVASALQIKFNGSELIPSEAWKSLPYLVTLLALAGFLGRNRTPAGLGKH